MARTFQVPEHMSSWRRLAPHVWGRPADPTVYGVMEFVVDRALPYIEALSAHAGTQIRLTHLITKALALGIEATPGSNGIVSRRQVKLRSTVDIFVQVATERGRDLSGIKIASADRKSLIDIGRELTERADRVRKHADPGVERTKSLVTRLPNALVGWTVRLMESLIYDLQLDLTRFGIASDQFGSAMVSNIGNFEGFGMSFALAPLVPISRVPIVVLIGKVQRKPVVENDRVVVRSVVTLGCTFDHRMIDGAQGSAIAAVMKRVVEDPEATLGPARAPVATVASADAEPVERAATRR
jgi:pyruvate dehydrogenase E2 component (dihydrolipoamide acetyltransferase)